MKYANLSLCLTAIVLCGCTRSSVYLYDKDQHVSAIIQIQDAYKAIVTDKSGKQLGQIRGAVVRDEKNQRVATVQSASGDVIIRNIQGAEIGTLQDNTDCIDENGRIIGHVSSNTNPEASAGACALVLIF